MPPNDRGTGDCITSFPPVKIIIRNLDKNFNKNLPGLAGGASGMETTGLEPATPSLQS